jgi:hypothetical protein
MSGHIYLLLCTSAWSFRIGVWRDGDGYHHRVFGNRCWVSGPSFFRRFLVLEVRDSSFVIGGSIPWLLHI